MAYDLSILKKHVIKAEIRNFPHISSSAAATGISNYVNATAKILRVV